MKKKLPNILHLLLSLGKAFLGLLIIYPLLYAFFVSAMKPGELFNYPPTFLPSGFHITNYIVMFQTIPIFKFMLNSLIVSAVIVIGQLLLDSMAAYAFAFFNFQGRKFLFITVLATTMIPGEATIVANFLNIAKLGLLDTYTALFLPHLVSAIGIFMLRQHYLTLPKELREAAIIDGCNSRQFLLKVVTPLSKGSLFSLGIYEFLFAWNMYLWPLLVTNTPEKRTVQIGIKMLTFTEAPSYAINFAGICMIILPSILMFMIGKQYLVEGMTTGAIKG